VLQELHGLFPAAPIYTSVHDPAGLPPAMQGWDIRSSALQRIPGAKRFSRALLPLMPWAFARLDLEGYDLVITVSSAFSKGVRTRPGAINLCYCLTPPRYLWTPDADSRAAALGAVARPLVARLQRQDMEAAERVHRFVAISETVRERIGRIYDRESQVIYPPVDTERIQPSGAEPEDFYLVVSRLVRQKRIDLAVEACRTLRRPLVVVGAGPERARLERMAGPTVRFTGALPDAQVFDLYRRCRAFLFPGIEDFGLTPVEAQAAGRPVVALGLGGAAETVKDGETGVLFPEQTASSLMAGVTALDGLRIDPDACRRNAVRFSRAVFRRAISDIVMSARSG
jgi:glycosyltransferase involved in cell wall biosynthesis